MRNHADHGYSERGARVMVMLQLFYQPAAQPPGEAFFNQHIADESQKDTDCNRHGCARESVGRAGGKVEYCPVQQHYRIIVYQI